MKMTVMIVLFVVTTGIACAQELSWVNTIDKAIEVSGKTKKPLMLFFTGSDWCGWCKRLQSEVFLKPEFAAWAEKNVVLVEIDFPKRTPLPPDIQSQNQQLQQFFGIRGYPTVWFVNAVKKDGTVSFEQLGSTGYIAGGPAVWTGAADSILKKKN